MNDNDYHHIIFNDDDPVNKALTALAARVNPTSNREYGWWEYIDESFDKRCLICCQKMKDRYVEDVAYHGMEHLKQHNLLPFV